MTLSLTHKILAGVIAMSLVTGALWAWTAAAERNARELAIAEEREKAAALLQEENAKRDRERAAEREATAKLIEANQQLADRLANSISQRNHAADLAIAQLRAAKTPEQVQKDAGKVLGVEPPIQTDGTFKVTMEQLQGCLVCKANESRLEANLADMDKRLRLVEDTNRRLVDENVELRSSNAEKDKIIIAKDEALAAYKKVATRSKWRKFGSAAGRVGLAVLPAVAVALIVK